MDRKSRQLHSNYYILCEGTTEYNYFNSFKQKIFTTSNVTIKIKNMHGGGYSNIMREIVKLGKTGFLAIFVIFDGDKAETLEEKKQLEKLINFCKDRNEKLSAPCFLIINSPNFEYVACLHDPLYKGKNTSIYIEKILGYRDLENFKSDVKIYEKLNTEPRSYNVMVKRLKKQHNKIIQNKYKVETVKKITISSTKSDLNAIGKNGSNINELFEILDIVLANHVIVQLHQFG